MPRRIPEVRSPLLAKTSKDNPQKHPSREPNLFYISTSPYTPGYHHIKNGAELFPSHSVDKSVGHGVMDTTMLSICTRVTLYKQKEEGK
jgi:hypothetical protein